MCRKDTRTEVRQSKMNHSTTKNDVFWLVLTVVVIMTSCVIYDFYHMPGNELHQVFGVSSMTLNNPFYEVINNELRKSVESKGDTLQILDPMLDAEKQAEQLNRMIDQGVSGIFLNPVDSSALDEVMTRAKESGIPVVVFDCPVDAEEYAGTTIVSNNSQAGALCAQDMMSRMDSARILLLEHSEVQSGSDRIQGFLSEIENHPEYEVVDRRECLGQLELAMPAAREALIEHPDINVIMSLNDPSALGASAAVELLDREGISIYGIDGTPEFKSGLKQKEHLQGTVAQSPYTIARIASSSMYSLLAGESVPKETVLSTSLITRDNLQDYSLHGWQ